MAARFYNAGHAYLSVMPSFKNIDERMGREASKLGAQIDRAVSKGLGEGMARGAREAEAEARRAGGSSGLVFASQFQAQIQKRLKDAFENMPEITPKANLSKFERALVRARRELGELSGLSIGPDGDADLGTVETALERIGKKLRGLQEEAKFPNQQFGLRAALAEVESISDAVEEARRRGAAAGASYGGAFAAESKKALDRVLLSLPKAKIDADTTLASRAVNDLRERLQELRDVEIDIDIDRDLFLRQLEQVRSELAGLAQSNPDLVLKYDVDASQKVLRDLIARVAPDMVQDMEGVGDKAAGAFQEGFRSRIGKALGKLPEIEITADTSPAEQALESIRAKLSQLRGARIGVDIDADGAEAEIAKLIAQLRRLDSDDVEVDVRTNAAAAAAELDLVKRGADDSAVSMLELGRQGGITMSRMGYLVALGATIGPVIAPAAAAAAAAVGFIGTAALSSAAGLGVLALGMSGVGTAIGALNKYQQDADKSAKSLSQAQNRIASGASQIAAAEQSLADARRRAEENRIDSLAKIAELEKDAAKTRTDALRDQEDAYRDINRAVDDAVADEIEAVRATHNVRLKARQDEADARKDVSRAIKDAIADEVEAEKDASRARADARKAEYDAQRDAAEAIFEAIERQTEAEKNLTEANRDQEEARRDLNDVIREAQYDLADLDVAVRKNANDVDRATTSMLKARQEYDKVLSDPKASALDRRQAKETYEQRIIQIDDLKNKGVELRDEQQRLNREGVEGTDKVRQARERLANADEKVIDAQNKVNKAILEVSNTQVENAQKLAEVREKSAERVEAAEKRVADQQEKLNRARIDGAQRLAEVEAANVERIADADRQRAEAKEKLRRVEEDGALRIAEIEERSAERIAEADKRIAEARLQSSRQQVQGQQSIISATRSLENAKRAEEQAHVAAGVAGGEALDNLRDAMDELSPAGRRFAEFIFGLKGEFLDLRAIAQAGMFPGFEQAITILLTKMPGLKGFVGDVAGALGELAVNAAEALTGPKWEEFFSYIGSTAVPTMFTLAEIAGNVSLGFANLLTALAPFNGQVGQGLVDFTARFAEWSARLDESSGYQDFLGYVERVGPKVGELIERMAEAILHIVIAAAPVGEVVLDAFVRLATIIADMDTRVLTGIIVTTAAFSAGLLALTGVMRGIRFVTEAYNAIVLLSGKFYDLVALAMARYRLSALGAATSAGVLNGAMFRSGAAGGAAAAGMGAASAAAGVLAAAIVGIGAIWYLQTKGARDAATAYEGLESGLKSVGEQFKDVGDVSKANSDELRTALRNATANNPGMQKTVQLLSDLGVEMDDIARAAAGQEKALGGAIAKIEEEMQRLDDEMREPKNFFQIFDNQKRADKIDELEEIRGKLLGNADALDVARESNKKLEGAEKGLTDQTEKLTPAQKALSDAADVLADANANAEQKTDALRDAMKEQTEAARNADAAASDFEQQLDDLAASVNTAKESGDRFATSLDITEQQGRDNRAMLRDLIEATNDQYDADVALNGVTDAGIKKHQGQIDKIVRLAKELGLSEKETRDLIKAMDAVDPNMELNFKSNNFQKVYDDLKNAQIAQYALKTGQDPANAVAEWNRMKAAAKGDYPQGSGSAGLRRRAGGGEIQGPGTSVSDSVPILASRGEWMQPHASVDYYGDGIMHALQHRLINRDALMAALPGFRKGGKIGVPIDINLKDTKIFDPSEAFAFGGGDFSGGLGNAGGGRGFQWQMAALRNIFPGLSLISGFRQGSRTLSGNLSYHAQGRAVDLPPRRDVAEYIAKTWGASTLELITPWRDLMLNNGRPAKFNTAIEAQHGVFGQNAHIHWAYDQGGMLPPGLSTVFNGTGRPEPVLTPNQWESVIEDRRGGNDGPREINQFHFGNTTLTPDILDARQRAKETLNRVGRRNR